MSVFKRLIDGLRGNINDAAEAVADQNVIAELGQQIRDLDTSLNDAKSNLSDLVGKASIKEKEVANIDTDIEKYTEGAKKAKEAGNMDSARKFVERVIQLKQQRSNTQALVDEYKFGAEECRKSVKQLQTESEKLKAEVDNFKASQAALKAQEAIATKSAGGKNTLAKARGAMDRAKAKQDERRSKIAAAREIDRDPTEDLDAELAALNSGSSDVDDMLNKL